MSVIGACCCQGSEPELGDCDYEFSDFSTFVTFLTNNADTNPSHLGGFLGSSDRTDTNPANFPGSDYICAKVWGTADATGIGTMSIDIDEEDAIQVYMYQGVGANAGLLHGGTWADIGGDLIEFAVWVAYADRASSSIGTCTGIGDEWGEGDGSCDSDEFRLGVSVAVTGGGHGNDIRYCGEDCLTEPFVFGEALDQVTAPNTHGTGSLFVKFCCDE